MINMKTDTSKKISLYGKIEFKNGNNDKNIIIKDKSIRNIIEHFYKTLEKDNIKLNEIEQVKVSKVTMDNEEIACDVKKFWINGYAKRKDDVKDKKMRNYFNIEYITLKEILQEFKILYEEYLSHFVQSREEIKIIVEGFKIL